MQSKVILFGRPDSWQISQVGEVPLAPLSHRMFPTNSLWAHLVGRNNLKWCLYMLVQMVWYLFFCKTVKHQCNGPFHSGNVSQESHHKHDLAFGAWGKPAQVTSQVFTWLITWKQSDLLIIIFYLLIIPLGNEWKVMQCRATVSSVCHRQQHQQEEL